MVPPRGSRPRQRSTSRVMVWRSSTPRHPSRKPTSSSSYWRSPSRTTARMTALSPGPSPPPLSSPTRMRATLPAVPTVLAIAPGPRLALGTVDSWILWNLTGGQVFATDPSNASRTMLYDIRYGSWSTELCDLFRVPVFALPEVRRTSGRFGTTADGIPVSALVGDQQAALFGQACLEPGMAKNTYGTGPFVPI